MKSRLDFFLVAKNLTRSVKKTEIYPSIAPDHAAIYISLSWEGKTPRGPGLWKFNNTLLKDEQYVAMIRDTYTQAQSYYSHLTDKRLFWEMMKIEIRTASISYAKSRAKSTYHREQEIKRQLDHFSLVTLIKCYKNMTTLKRNLHQFTRIKEASYVQGKVSLGGEWRTSDQIFLNLEKRNYNKNYRRTSIAG